MAKKKKKNWENAPKPSELRKKLDGVSLGKDKDGYFVYTHRARSSSYPEPGKIPQSKIDFIESTGSVHIKQLCANFLIVLADELDQEDKPELANALDDDFEEFLKLLEDGELLFDGQFSGGARDPRGPYSNLGRGPLPACGIPGPQCDDKKAHKTFLLSKRAGQTYEDDDRAYSVDMLIEITAKNKIENVPLSTLEWNMEEKVWDKNHSPQDVIENPKKHSKDYKKIEEAELKYPILVYKGEIVDGYHRLAKAVLQKKKDIKARIVTDKQMDVARTDKERMKELIK